MSSVDKGKLSEFIEFAINCNLKEAETAKDAEEYELPPTYWLGRVQAFRNLKRRMEEGEFDE